MLDSIYAGIATVTYVIQIVGNVALWIFNVNYQFVAAVGHHLTWFFSLISHYVGVVKLVLYTVWFYAVGFVTDIYQFLESVCCMILKLASVMCEFFSSMYLNASYACDTVGEFITSSSMFVKSSVLNMYNLVSAGASHSVGFVVAAWSSVFLLVASLGAACVQFVNALWYGLGFLMSSVASLPTFLSKSAEKLWDGIVESATAFLMATTKETYLGIVMLCLVYLTLSNFMRFFSCRSLPLFSRRMRRRRQRNPGANPWRVDRGFESDLDDMFGSDEEGRDSQPTWLNLGHNNEEAEHDREDNSISDASDNNLSDNDDNGDDDTTNDSDEYTVESENSEDDDDDDGDESDAESVNSRNSQTFSTGSSEHDIEVQLPPLHLHYSLRSRSSTPARHPDKHSALSCPEDFSREMERERDKRKCVVCQDEIKCVLVLPCRHLCMCVVCADQIVRSRIPGRRTCPLCRTKITKVMNIYV
ncbi:hypothetical protein EGW08_010775 [Elysia chlorotica]|uniref:RING-type domain-containing protein n=1 Tax=Elysia chlorotica TaxID=188477 RepID=A0A3S1BID7_ELYCH|nr:hypothetical protein EGW08_010775 [Elysia chlorotica]